MSSDFEPPQPTQELEETQETIIVEPPQPPQPKTIIVTERPLLIPNENASVYCLTRRNIFDAVIAIVLASGIIYFVMSLRGAKPYTGLTRTMGRAANSVLGVRGATKSRGFGPGANISGIAGGFKKIIKSFFK